MSHVLGVVTFSADMTSVLTSLTPWGGLGYGTRHLRPSTAPPLRTVTWLASPDPAPFLLFFFFFSFVGGDTSPSSSEELSCSRLRFLAALAAA